MKKFIALILALVMVMGLVACGAKADEKIPVHFIVAQYSDATGPYYEKVIAAFEEANPNIDVTMEVMLTGREYRSWSVRLCFSSATERMVSTGTASRYTKTT